MTQQQAPETTHAAVRAAINANATDAESRLFNSVVIVKQASDLAVIDSTMLYFIDSVIDMAGASIEVPAGGISLAGHSFDISKLIDSTAAYTMFTSPGGGSGNVLMLDIALEVTGAGSQVFNLTDATGFDAFEINRVNFNDCTSLGSFTNYRQGFEAGTGRFGGTPNLELIGTWVGGYFIDNSIVRSLDAGMTGALYEAGAGFTMASRFRSNQNIDLPASAAFLDFAPANFTNPSTVQLDECIVSRNGVLDANDANLIPNMTQNDLAAQWRGNNGLQNTYVGGQNKVTSETTTTIGMISTFVDLAATWTSSDLTHFDSPGSGQLRHLGNTPREYRISADLTISGTANDDIAVRVRVWDDSATAFVDLTPQIRPINNLSGGRDVAFFGLFANLELDQNDYAILQVANNSGTGNVTVEDDSFYLIDARN